MGTLLSKKKEDDNDIDSNLYEKHLEKCKELKSRMNKEGRDNFRLVMVLGQHQQGKSSLLNALINMANPKNHGNFLMDGDRIEYKLDKWDEYKKGVVKNLNVQSFNSFEIDPEERNDGLFFVPRESKDDETNGEGQEEEEEEQRKKKLPIQHFENRMGQKKFPST